MDHDHDPISDAMEALSRATNCPDDTVWIGVSPQEYERLKSGEVATLKAVEVSAPRESDLNPTVELSVSFDH